MPNSPVTRRRVRLSVVRTRTSLPRRRTAVTPSQSSAPSIDDTSTESTQSRSSQQHKRSLKDGETPRSKRIAARRNKITTEAYEPSPMREDAWVQKSRGNTALKSDSFTSLRSSGSSLVENDDGNPLTVPADHSIVPDNRSLPSTSSLGYNDGGGPLIVRAEVHTTFQEDKSAGSGSMSFTSPETQINSFDYE